MDVEAAPSAAGGGFMAGGGRLALGAAGGGVMRLGGVVGSGERSVRVGGDDVLTKRTRCCSVRAAGLASVAADATG